MLIDHYIVIFLFKPKNWVMCHQSATLEEAIVSMVEYASAEAEAYLIPKVRKGQVEKRRAGQGEQGVHWGGERMGKPTQESHDREMWIAEQEQELGQTIPHPWLSPGIKCQGFRASPVDMGHFQRECPHTECMWTNVLRGSQVKDLGLDLFV